MDRGQYIFDVEEPHGTYGHKRLKIEDPVRSPVLKPSIGELVLRWVTTWESYLPYVFVVFSFCDYCR